MHHNDGSGSNNENTISRRYFLQDGGCFMLAFAIPISFVSGSGSDNQKRYTLPTADGASIDRQAQVILVRYRNEVYAFALSCPHENAAVKWLPKDQRFQCTKHDSRYQPDGVHTAGRATRNLDRFAIHREGDAIVVDLQHWFQSDKDPSGWNSAAIQL